MAVPFRHPFLAGVVLLAGALTIAACSDAGTSSSSSGASVARGGVAAGAAPGREGSSSPATAGTLSPAAVTPRVVRTATIQVQVEGDLAAAAARVRAVAQSLQGTVSSETTTYADAGDGEGLPGTAGASGAGAPEPVGPAASATGRTPAARPGESVLVLRVPEGSLDRALTLIAGPGGVGEELSRSATAQDVTADLADLESRVATQRASVTRVRALLAKASSLQDVVTLEAEVTKRESDLEAAEARRAALADQADLATLTVDLRTPRAVGVAAQQPNAFLDGLRSGWRALTATTTVILTVLGALLPIVVAVVVVGGPVAWWLRRRRGPSRPAAATSPAAATDQGS